MLGRVLVGDPRGLLVVFDEEDLHRRPPTPAARLPGSPRTESGARTRGARPAEGARRGDQDRRRRPAVLGLTEKIGGDHERDRRRRPRSRGSRRPREQIDAHLSRRSAAWPRPRTDFPGLTTMSTAGCSRSRRPSPRAPARRRVATDVVDAGGDHRVERGRIDPTAGIGRADRARRRAGDDAPDPCDLRGGDAHERGGHQGIPSAGHVRPTVAHRQSASARAALHPAGSTSNSVRLARGAEQTPRSGRGSSRSWRDRQRRQPAHRRLDLRRTAACSPPATTDRASPVPPHSHIPLPAAQRPRSPPQQPAPPHPTPEDAHGLLQILKHGGSPLIWEAESKRDRPSKRLSNAPAGRREGSRCEAREGRGPRGVLDVR